MHKFKTVFKKAIDVTPLTHAVLCTFPSNREEVVLNTIELRRWTDDKKKIVCLLESHNTLFWDPNEIVEVVEIPPQYHYELMVQCLERDAIKMGVPFVRPRIPTAEIYGCNED